MDDKKLGKKNILPKDILNKLFLGSKNLITISGLFAVVAYVASRLFIITYFSKIGFQQLKYSVLVNNDTTSIIFLAIILTLILLFLLFIGIPFLLNYLYQKDFVLYSDLHEKHKKKITIFLQLCFLTPLLMLLPTGYRKYFAFSPALTFLLFIFFFLAIRKNSIKENFVFLFHGMVFSIASLCYLFPFYILIENIDGANKPSIFVFFSIIVFWFLYSYFTALSIVSTEEKIYLRTSLPVFFIFLYFLFSVSCNFFLVPTANFVGIRDSEARIYQLSEVDYKKIATEISLYWQLGDKCESGDNCKMIEGRYNADDGNDIIFLNTQVIFRDRLNAIICPPNYKLNQLMNSRCFLIESKNIKPTSQTIATLESNPKIIVNHFHIK